MPINNRPSIKKVRRQSRVLAFHRRPLKIVIAKEAFYRRLIVPSAQSDDDHVNMSHAPRVAAPCESPVSEGDFQSVALEYNRPKLRHLLALCDGIRGDESDPRMGSLEIRARFDELGCDVIQCAAATAQLRYAPNLLALHGALILCAAERRIAEKERASLRLDHALPVRFKRVDGMDVRRFPNWNTQKALEKLL